MGVKVKKNTIDTEAFEWEMSALKQLIAQHPTNGELIVKEINNIAQRLIEFIDEKEPEPFKIPDWIHRI